MFENVIKKYIMFLRKNEQVNKYVPNYHIAATFVDVLIHLELEDKYREIYSKVKRDPVDSIGNNNIDDYDETEDGRFVPKQTYSIEIGDIVVDYFNTKRLKIGYLITEHVQHTL